MIDKMYEKCRHDWILSSTVSTPQADIQSQSCVPCLPGRHCDGLTSKIIIPVHTEGHMHTGPAWPTCTRVYVKRSKNHNSFRMTPTRVCSQVWIVKQKLSGINWILSAVRWLIDTDWLHEVPIAFKPCVHFIFSNCTDTWFLLLGTYDRDV